MPARARNPFTGVQLAKRGYSALLPRHERRELLVLIHQELEMESEEYLKSHLVASLLNLARLQKTRNPQLSARYSSDSLFVSANFKGSNSEGPEDDLPGKKPKKPRAPTAPRAKKPPRVKAVPYNDDSDDNDPWSQPGRQQRSKYGLEELNRARKKLREEKEREEKYPDEDEKMDYRYSDDDDDSDDESGDVHFENARISGGKRRRDDEDDEKAPKKSKKTPSRKRKNNEAGLHGESKRARKTASRKRKVRRDGLGDDDPASNKRPRTEAKSRKRKNDTPGEILQAEEENPGISLLHPQRHDQYLEEEKEYANNVGSIAAGRDRRTRPRIDYAAMHSGNLDGGTIYFAGLQKKHVQAWAKDKGVRFDGGSLSLVPTVKHTHGLIVPEAVFKKAQWAMKDPKKRNINVKMTPHHFLHNALMEGGGFGDFIDGVINVGKKVLDVASTYILPIASQILEALPISDPRFQFIKGLVATASKVAKGLNEIVNKKEEQKAVVDEKTADLYEGASRSQTTRTVRRTEGTAPEEGIRG